MRIDYYLTPLSPFTYLAGDRLERIAEARGARVRYRPADMGRILAAGGTRPVPERPLARQEYRLQELERIARREGLPINLHPAHWPTDPVPGSLAIIAAQEAAEAGEPGDVGAVVRALLEACWARERDIAEAAVIADALDQAGFSPRLLDERTEPRAREIYEENTEAALAAGVFGAPFYIVGDARFWGQDRLSYLDEHLDRLTGEEEDRDD
ncbi:MAG: 2-hydroxychromene-2-carboxylate isomerase [Pseudomonadota bacterium]